MLQSPPRTGRTKISTALFLLWSIFLLGFAVSFFYFKNKNEKLANLTTAADITNTTDSKDTLVMPAAVETTPMVDAPEEKHKPGKKVAKAEVKAKPIEEPKPSQGKYKILSKAYFHNEPDERTRRNAFVNRWNNSYATLNALDEKNDFIYVEFRNHLNQTSKGWLRKKDLQPVTVR